MIKKIISTNVIQAKQILGQFIHFQTITYVLSLKIYKEFKFYLIKVTPYALVPAY